MTVTNLTQKELQQAALILAGAKERADKTNCEILELDKEILQKLKVAATSTIALIGVVTAIATAHTAGTKIAKTPVNITRVTHVIKPHKVAINDKPPQELSYPTEQANYQNTAPIFEKPLKTIQELGAYPTQPPIYDYSEGDSEFLDESLLNQSLLHQMSMTSTIGGGRVFLSNKAKTIRHAMKLISLNEGFVGYLYDDTKGHLTNKITPKEACALGNSTKLPSGGTATQGYGFVSAELVHRYCMSDGQLMDKNTAIVMLYENLFNLYQQIFLTPEAVDLWYLTPKQRAAVLSRAWQDGVSGLRSSKFYESIKDKDLKKASSELLRNNKSRGQMIRRIRENTYLTGKNVQTQEI